MNEKQNSFSTTMTPEEAQKEIVVIRRQLADLQSQNRAMWTLLAEVSRRLQASSTSIKAAASSLLDHDIFWDGSNQHEFLETIDNSVDQSANLITLMMLAFRSEANTLEMKPEPHTLQEILSTVLDTIATQKPEIRFDALLPTVGKPVLVDYEYLAVGLRLLLEVLVESGMISSKLKLHLTESTEYWHLDILDLRTSIGEAITHLCRNRLDNLMLLEHISPENVLKLFTASRILHLQNIQMKVQAGNKGEMVLHLTIPAVFTT